MTNERVDEAIKRRGTPEGDALWDEIFSELDPLIKRICVSILKNEVAAEDAAQQTYLHAWDKLDQFRRDALFWTWISRIAINVCIDVLRKAKSRPAQQFRDLPGDDGNIISEADLISSTAADPYRRYAEKEASQIIQKTLGRVSSSLTEPFILMRFVGLDATETSLFLRRNKNSVKVQDLRIRGEIAHILYKDHLTSVRDFF